MTAHRPILPARSRLSIRIVSDGHLRDGHAPPFRSTLEAHAYQHRRRIRSGYGTEFDFGFRAGDIVGAELILPPGPDPFAGNPEAFARGCDTAAAQMTFHAPISSLIMLGDVARDCSAGEAMLRVRAFVEAQVLPMGLGVDAVLHDPRRKGDAAGLHAHLLVSVRTLTANGFGPFIRIAKEPGTFARWRASWAAIVAT